MCNACDRRFLGFMRNYHSRRDVLEGMTGAAAAFVASMLPSASTLAQDPHAHADLIFHGGTIHTLDSRLPSVEAVAVKSGKIVARGSWSDLRGLKGSATKVVDLEGMSLLPGFVDPHMHSNFSGLRPWLDVGPFTTRDLTKARDKIRDAAARAELNTWVQGKMLDPSIMSGNPFSRADLDEISPNIPVFILESNGHVAYVNSRAIEIAGLTRETPDPPQARFGRDANGDLNGRLEEPNAFQPFVAVMPSPSVQELVGFLRADMDEAASRGCTALHDCGIGGLFAEGDLALIDSAMMTNPPVRYAGFLVSTHFAKWKELGLRPGPRSSRFTLNGIKAWADGSNQGLTGYQRQPYIGTQNRGALNYTPEEIEAVVREAHEAGWQIGVHGNGDAAIDIVLDAFERGTNGEGGHRLRHRIEHCSLLDEGQMRRMAALGISPSFLIGHVHFWGQAFRDRLLGPDRADKLDPCRSALNAGLRISLHSDFNVTPIDPLRCIQNAVLRDMRESGDILNPKECITVMDGIRAMTIDAAWQCHLDHLCGSLEVGKVADFVVLEKDPIQVRSDEIQGIRVHSTWLDGEKRFSG